MQEFRYSLTKNQDHHISKFILKYEMKLSTVGQVAVTLTQW